jgi:hypothetical protein
VTNFEYLYIPRKKIMEKTIAEEIKIVEKKKKDR